MQRLHNDTHMRQTQVENYKYCGTGHPRDIALPTARLVENAERPTTLRQCAGQCEDSRRSPSKTRPTWQKL